MSRILLVILVTSSSAFGFLIPEKSNLKEFERRQIEAVEREAIYEMGCQTKFSHCVQDIKAKYELDNSARASEIAQNVGISGICRYHFKNNDRDLIDVKSLKECAESWLNDRMCASVPSQTKQLIGTTLDLANLICGDNNAKKREPTYSDDFKAAWDCVLDMNTLNPDEVKDKCFKNLRIDVDQAWNCLEEYNVLHQDNLYKCWNNIQQGGGI